MSSRARVSDALVCELVISAVAAAAAREWDPNPRKSCSFSSSFLYTWLYKRASRPRRPGRTIICVLVTVSAFVSSSFAAVARARLAVASVAVTYVAFVAIGIGMVSIGNTYAIERRAAIVAGAQNSDILMADRSGDHLKAAVLDFVSNLVGVLPAPLPAFR